MSYQTDKKSARLPIFLIAAIVVVLGAIAYTVASKKSDDKREVSAQAIDGDSIHQCDNRGNNSVRGPLVVSEVYFSCRLCCGGINHNVLGVE